MRKLVVAMVTVALTVVFGLAGTALAGDPGKGEEIFKGKRKCKTCHKLTAKKKVGPGLKGVTDRRSEGWLKKWLTNPQATWVENDAETQKLKEWKKGRKKAKKTTMKFKLPLSPTDVEDVIAFLKKNDGK
ncbi:hypothetical protein MNBD_NITROSPINAE02-261 [hydrothermal vent metagenome]|uniref:Cytochrome c domain-containing protein n=1 Tax=hydrothermal vent metagenome TaxID=652676 RepID=A0A3B1D8D6_9ZZZZ